jgi:hypothetical protein
MVTIRAFRTCQTNEANVTKRGTSILIGLPFPVRADFARLTTFFHFLRCARQPALKAPLPPLLLTHSSLPVSRVVPVKKHTS